MCGIAGTLGDTSGMLLKKMLPLQQHRGPDNTSTWHENQIALGHNRLSIIDLSHAANQPMHDARNRYHIVFNGEIYNYLELKQQFFPNYNFTNASDTQVLLAMYELMGEKMLHHLNGMFAFAIWDSQEQQLFAARDRFGVKPFYYATINSTWIFASEIKTLWAAGIAKSPAEKVWSTFLAAGHYGLPHETFWQNIVALPAGHTLTIRHQQAPVISRWYDFENAIANQRIFEKDADIIPHYQELLLDAVSLRFRADVPVGFNLSGGLDSSTLLAAVHHLFPQNQQIKGYSFYCNDDRYDELPWVKQLMSHTGKPLEPVLLNVEDVPEKASAMAHLQDEPYGGIPTIAYGEIFSAARKAGTLVLLDGQGMDEAWGGYDYYYKPGGGLVQGTNRSPVAVNTLTPAFASLSHIPDYPTPFNNALQNMQYRDIFYTKIPRALRFNDRASMMHSTELREPFLDHRLVAFAFALPLHFKMQNGITKFTLRKIATSWIGSELALAPKRPLQTPQREWLRGPLREWAESHINWLTHEGNPGWFDKKEVAKTWQEYLQEKSDNSFYVWQWLNTAMLLKKQP